MNEIEKCIHNIPDPEAKREIQAAAQFIKRLNPEPLSARDIVHHIATAKTFSDCLSAQTFLSRFGGTLKLDAKALGGAILEELTTTTDSRNRELLYGCVTEGLFEWSRNKVVTADLLLNRLIAEVEKDLRLASHASGSRTEQEHLTFFVALSALALCAIHSRELLVLNATFPDKEFSRPSLLVMRRFMENWKQARLASLMQNGESIRQLQAILSWVSQSERLQPAPVKAE